MRRTVAVATFCRSDFSSLRPVIRAAREDPDIDLRIIAGGSHLLERFGRSIDEVREVCGTIHATCDFLGERDDGEADLARAHARLQVQCTDFLAREAIDSLFLLGDRWELLAPATAAALLRIPIIHHSGGDLTQGSFDNQTRYVLSTLAHLHLVAIDEHARRLLALGEESWRITVVGEPALVGIAEGLAGTDDIRATVGISSDRPFVLATHHPTTHDAGTFLEQVRCFIEALEAIDGDILLTAPNPDPGGLIFMQALERAAQANPRIHFVKNLGRERYYAAMAAADFMIGNSSSGIWEAPSFGLPVLNIGRRQAERLRGANVVDVPLERGAIRQAIAGMTGVRLRPEVRERINPYVRKDTIQRILGAWKHGHERTALLAKRLVDPLAERQAWPT